MKDYIPLLTMVLGAFVGFFSSFFTTLGRIHAERAERDELKKQLAENTRLTQSIVNQIGQEEFLARRELEFRERQLAEFYGPVYGYLKSQKDIHGMWMEGLLGDKNFEVKQLFAKQNAIVRDLIISKMHLIDSPEMPEHFIRYLTDTLIFDIYAAPTPDGRVPDHVAGDARVKYPDEFNEHVFTTAVSLKQRTKELNEKFAIRLRTSP